MIESITMASMVRCNGAAWGPISGTIDTMAIRWSGTAQNRRVPPPSQPKLPTGKRVPAAAGIVTLTKPRPNLTPSGAFHRWISFHDERTDLVGGHLLDGFRLQVLPTIEAAIIRQHASKK